MIHSRKTTARMVSTVSVALANRFRRSQAATPALLRGAGCAAVISERTKAMSVIVRS
ncbi:hypothetical protein [Devosia sp.]|uniref:hypothetical protein n=1 Tax=Devosia sp. TaxID=1871048 RepID=UPI0025BF51CD|nr:hypothetical protein [Devosia sp.]